MADSFEKSLFSGSTFSVEIQPVIPERFARLPELANDLYYSWNRGVRGLFRHLDEQCWNASLHNPRVFMRRIRQHKLDEAAHNPILLSEYRHVLATYDTYHEEQPTTSISRYLDPQQDTVAYFSAEFGFHESMPIYAGGLGILAADYCKAMSNLWVPFVGVGLLYRQGYFSQQIGCNGEQLASYPERDPCDLPVSSVQDDSGAELRVQVELPGRSVQIKVWQAKVGKIRLLLLDSDVPENTEVDRKITAQLYGGDGNTRLQQELLLGMGGVRALGALGIEPTVWHINEGHSAFLIIERCLRLQEQGMDFDTALEAVAANTVFTTHTPVPAGHDVFAREAIKQTFDPVMQKLGISEARFFALGEDPAMAKGFSMTSLALHGSRYHNGVSRIHGGVAAQMSAYVWPEIEPRENPLSYVTNGADVDTYLAAPWVSLFEMYMGGGWRAKLMDQEFWCEFIDSIPTHVFLSVRQVLKVSMLEELHRRASNQYRRCPATRSRVGHLTRFLNGEHKDTLFIGFARRFATYKRATLLFKDLERFKRLVNNPDRPVVFIFAGKAHPNDTPGQKLMKQIHEISMLPEIQGKVILLEDYNLSMTRELLPGVDVWLNNPEYPLEACGTSGMKAAINGVINVSVLDGWWAEACDGTNGWGITPYPEMAADARLSQEADDLMTTLENEVIPAYYARNSVGEPEDWIARAKASMQTILPRFNTIRMAMDYLRDLYGPAARGGRRLGAEAGTGARELARWKQKIARHWPAVSARILEPLPTRASTTDTSLAIQVEVDLDGLDIDDIVVECVIGRMGEAGGFQPVEYYPLDETRREESGVVYAGDLFEAAAPICSVGGLQYFKIRIYPYHPLLSHRFECGRMLWL